MKSNRYQITAPTTPGAKLSVQAERDTLTEARAAAKRVSRDRPDLRWQDVRIEHAGGDSDGCLVEYAGPNR